MTVEIVRDTRSAERSPFLSVVVPCHNVETVVLETLESLWQMGRYKDLECLIIDDGSEDQTLAVVSAWLDQGSKPGMLLVRQSNRGLSAVRNLGAQWAKGRWLAFLDSDDRVTPSGFSAMWAIAQSTRADLLLGGARIVESSEDTEGRPFYHHRAWQRLVTGGAIWGTTVGLSPELLALEPNVNYRWFRREFFEHTALHFPEGRLFEDISVHFRAMLNASSVALVNAPYYLYRVNRPGKITESRTLRRFDALVTLGMAADELLSASLNGRQAAFALRGMARLAWGCGRMTPLSVRLAYFRGLTQLWSRLPKSWCLRSLWLWPLERPFLNGLLIIRVPHLLALASLIRRP